MNKPAIAKALEEDADVDIPADPNEMDHQSPNNNNYDLTLQVRQASMGGFNIQEENKNNEEQEVNISERGGGPPNLDRVAQTTDNKIRQIQFHVNEGSSPSFQNAQEFEIRPVQ